MDTPFEVAGENPLSVVVVASTLAELFEYAGLAISHATYAIDRVRVHRDVPVMAVGDTPEALLEDWIIEILSAVERHGLVTTTVAVDRLETGGVQGAIGGARADEFAVIRPAVTGIVRRPDIVRVPDGLWTRLELEN